MRRPIGLADPLKVEFSNSRDLARGPLPPRRIFFYVSGHGPAFASRLGRGVAHARSRGRCMQNLLALVHDALARINGAFCLCNSV
jgi:hypothetical protein